MQQFLQSNVCHYGCVLWPQLYFLCIDEKLRAQWTSVTDMTLIRSGKKTKQKQGCKAACRFTAMGKLLGFFQLDFEIDCFAMTHGVPGLKVLDFQHVLHFSA